VRMAYFDPFSGGSGDMILGALIDAGASLTDIRAGLAGLAVASYEIEAQSFSQHGVSGTKFDVVVHDDFPARNWKTIRNLISSARLKPHVKEHSLAIFGRLAEAEAGVHGVPVDDVHFHEVGGIDAIIDICGACVALDLLGVEAVYSGPLRAGAGFVRAAHGLLPVPAPATAALLASAHAPLAGPLPSEKPPGELLTPTGAAILTTLARFEQPAFTISSTGSGFGSRELPWPNMLRVTIGEASSVPAVGEADSVLQIETNLDDLSPQHIELLVERLFAAGALDVWTTPIGMKKGRPALLVSVLAGESDRDEIVETIILNTTTLGVRLGKADRIKAARRFETVVTRWGEVAVKLRGWNGRVIDVAPEYGDCARLARDSGATLRDVWNEAHRAAEVFVGRRLSNSSELLSLP
jgi:pyridinium-3,5-bisthiocarboxylic acid mononucleotide nickel chelatase